MKRVKAADRNLAVISMGVAVAKADRRDISMFLSEVISDAITTKSELLVHHVLICINSQSKRAWSKFVADVEAKANERRRVN